MKNLVGDEILAKPVMSWDYQMILPEGTCIKKEYISHLEELGILEVYVKDEERLSTHEIAILRSDIEDSVKVKVKDILERHTYQKNEELAELSETADSIITNIVEEEKVVEKIYDIKERSTDIYEHSINTCSLAILTSLKLGIKKEIIHDIGVGCLLHDLGLRYTTIDLIEKDVQSLNHQQTIEFRKHPVYGYTSIQKETWISDISKSIILYHHERLDGSGFPLRTKDIPFECQIVSVCDAFDEMICGIINKSMKLYEAVEYLKNTGGTLFNKKIVDALLSFIAVYPAGSRVRTSDGEIAIVLSQNKNFQDRPILRIIQDSDGNDVEEEVIRDMVKIPSLFITEILEY